MSLAESKITSQGQISVPAKVRKRLGLAPGSVIEWHEQDGEIVVKRASKYSSSDIHCAIFGKRKAIVSVEDFDEGIKSRMRKKHERR